MEGRLGAWQTWWRDSTDPVVLSSPLLRNYVSPVVFIGCLVGNVTWTFFEPWKHVQGQKLTMPPALPWTTTGLLLLALLSLARNGWFPGLFVQGCGGMASMTMLMTVALVVDLRALSFYFLGNIVLLCICQVHPLILASTGLTTSAFTLLKMMYDEIVDGIEVDQITEEAVIQFFWLGTMVLVYTRDFSAKVTAIHAGDFIGEADRSANATSSALELRRPSEASTVTGEAPGVWTWAKQLWKRSIDPYILSSPIAGRGQVVLCRVLCLSSWMWWLYIEAFVFTKLRQHGHLTATQVFPQISFRFLCLITCTLLVSLALWQARRQVWFSTVLLSDLLLATIAVVPLLMIGCIAEQVDHKAVNLYNRGVILRRLLCVLANGTIMVGGSLYVAVAHPAVCGLAYASVVLATTRIFYLYDVSEMARNALAMKFQPSWYGATILVVALAQATDFHARIVAIERSIRRTMSNAYWLQNMVAGQRRDPSMIALADDEEDGLGHPNFKAVAAIELQAMNSQNVSMSSTGDRQESSSVPTMSALASSPGSSPSNMRRKRLCDRDGGPSGHRLNRPDVREHPGSDFPHRRHHEAKDRLTVAVVRHSDRADSAWDAEWFRSQDSVEFSADPPITKGGRERATQLAAGLKLEAPFGFQLIVTSPYLRCVQTALILAEHMDAELLLDAELGEVYGPHVFGEQPSRDCPWRPRKRLIEALDGYDVERLPESSQVRGTPPEWPESLADARVRYANRFLTYLRRARHVKKNVLLVTHGYGLQACMATLPQTSNLEVASTGFCSCMVAKLHSKLPAPLARQLEDGGSPKPVRKSELPFPTRRPSRGTIGDGGRHSRPSWRDCSRPSLLAGSRLSLIAGSRSSLRAVSPDDVRATDSQRTVDEQDLREEQNKVLQDALLHYWEVSLTGIEYIVANKRKPETERMLARLGPSWNEIERLLGVLPPMAVVKHGGRTSGDLGSFVSMRTQARMERVSFETSAETVSSMDDFKNPRRGRLSSAEALQEQAAEARRWGFSSRRPAAQGPAAVVQLDRSSVATLPQVQELHPSMQGEDVAEQTEKALREKWEVRGSHSPASKVPLLSEGTPVFIEVPKLPIEPREASGSQPPRLEAPSGGDVNGSSADSPGSAASPESSPSREMNLGQSPLAKRRAMRQMQLAQLKDASTAVAPDLGQPSGSGAGGGEGAPAPAGESLSEP